MYIPQESEPTVFEGTKNNFVSSYPHPPVLLENERDLIFALRKIFYHYFALTFFVCNPLENRK
jgi:hypothetical protein